MPADRSPETSLRAHRTAQVRLHVAPEQRTDATAFPSLPCDLNRQLEKGVRHVAAAPCHARAPPSDRSHRNDVAFCQPAGVALPAMGYEQFFGLNDAPFTLAPNPRYLFESASHTDALTQLAYAIDRREPLIIVTGEIGTGKTLLCRTVLQRLDRRTFVSVINDPLLERDDLLKQMLQDFGVMSSDRTRVLATSRHDLVHALEDFLSSLIALDAHGVVMIDEAQHVQPDVLEQIRLLSSVDAPSGTRLQIVLVGQLDLEALLGRPELRQFQQRVSRRIRLEPLKESELRAYIDHRLAVGRAAGSQIPNAVELARALAEWEGSGADAGVTFTDDAVRAVWMKSAGLPRVVNLLCDRALEAAYAQRLRTVDADLVEAAADALQLKEPPLAQVEAPVQLPIAAPVQLPAAAPVPLPVASPVQLPVAAPVQLKESHRDTKEDVLVSSQPDANDAFSPLTVVTPPSASNKGPVIGAVVAVLVAAAVAVWFTSSRSGNAPPTTTQAAPQSVQAPAPSKVAPSTAAPVERSVEPPPVSRPTAAAAAVTPSAAVPPAGTSASMPFEILVASFKTELRAASVAAQVTAAGLHARQRATGGWQQVLAGPFSSRAEADAARVRLEHAGLPGTQIVAAEH